MTGKNKADEGHKRIHVLCIEDNEDDYEIVKRSLKEEMKELITLEWASTGSSGLKIVLSGKFDILLLDYRLPDADGIELMDIIKREGLVIPVIMLTGEGDENIAVKAMKKGAIDYIVKSDLGSKKLSKSVMQIIGLVNFMNRWDTGLKEIGRLGKRRGTLSILASVLGNSLNGIGKTQLVHRTNLNFKSIKKYLAFLINKDFLSVRHEREKEIFKTTKKGIDILKQFKEIEEYFD